MELQRKYLSEYAVNFCSARWLMLPANQLKNIDTLTLEEKETAEQCHIYFICKTPSLTYEKKSFSFIDETVEGLLQYKVKGEKRHIPFKQQFPLRDNAIRLSLSDHPHREIQTFDKENEIIRYFPADAMCYLNGLHVNNSELNSLEVMYIGQSFGDGTRSALDRLKSHSTLQKILADVQYNDPDSNVFLLAFEYTDPRLCTMINGKSSFEPDEKEEEQRFKSILDNPLTEHQEICLIEAGLIRYFQPLYNEIYKESFPSLKHKILAECYELDFSGLIVEVNTETLGFNLFSRGVVSNTHHISSYDLVSHDDRMGFFYFSGKDGSPVSVIDITAGS